MSLNPSKLLLAAVLLSSAPAWAALTVNTVDGTVTDTTTNLVWDQCVYGKSGSDCATVTTPALGSWTALTGTWSAALTAAVEANTARYKGFNDWRVPNVKELESIVKIDISSPAIDSTAFPATPITGYGGYLGGVWSSTSSASTAYQNPTGQAFFVSFESGSPNYYYKTHSFYVRLVRGGQSSAAFDLLPAPIPVNGACVTGQTLTVAPSNTNLCTAGTAGVVTTDPTSYTWACLGSNGGSDAPNCSAVRNYVVTSSVTGGNGAISASQNVAYNATPSFTLTPAPGFVASAMTGTCGGSLSANSFTTSAVTASCTVVASFAAAPVTSYVLDVSKTGTGSGTVTSDIGGINCGATCSASYASGATVTLAAAAASNSTFTGWSGACTGTASCVVSMSVARSVVANFAVTPVPTGAVAPIPTLSEWAMVLLATLMALLGLAQVRRKPD